MLTVYDSVTANCSVKMSFMKGLTLNQKEQNRLQVMNRLLEGVLDVGEASELLGVSQRQVRRLRAAYREEGACALAHGNRGRAPIHKVSQEVRAQVVELGSGRYAGFNHTHLTEELGRHEGIALSRSTVRRILSSAGMRSPRKRRGPKHRVRRERYAQEGMLLQVDGSRHDWLEGRGPYLTLIGAVDDATGTIPYALFCEQEDAHGYFLLTERVIRDKGIPLALYSDRHGIFQRSPSEAESLEEQLAGERSPTQFGRAMRELGIESVLAQSPQAKGRVERMWGTLQDRLVSLLRLEGASCIEDANRVLASVLPEINEHFGVAPRQTGSAYRQMPEGLLPESVLCFKYMRTVANDNTIRFANRTIQLLPDMQRMSYARARVEVQERLDGTIVVCHRGKVIAVTEAPESTCLLRARRSHPSERKADVSRHPGQPQSHSGPVAPQGRNGTAAKTTPRPRKPAPDRLWRRPLLTKSLNT